MCNVYLRKKREHVYVVFYLNRNDRIFLSTGVSIKDKFWEKDFIKETHPQYRSISRKLTRYLKLGEAALGLLPEKPTGQEIRKKFLELVQQNEEEEERELNLRVEFTLVQDFEKFISRRKGSYKLNTVKKYITLYNILKEFEAEGGYRLDVGMFDKLVFEKFLSFLLENKNLQNNSVAKHVATLKTFLLDTYPSRDLSFIKFKWFQPTIVALRSQELKLLIDTPVIGINEKVKDLFIFMCFTGLRVSDVMRFDPKLIDGDTYIYSAEKTMSEGFVPIKGVVKAILEKYDGKPPRMAEQYFNRQIKEVFKDLGLDRAIKIKRRQGRNEYYEIKPLHDVVSSHTGRKTFISLALSKGIPIQTVMSASGHQDYRSIKPYINLDRSELEGEWEKFEL